jgi:hypothetical protein
MPSETEPAAWSSTSRIFCVFITSLGNGRCQDGKLAVWSVPYGIAQYSPPRCPAARRLHSGNLCAGFCERTTREPRGGSSTLPLTDSVCHSRKASKIESISCSRCRIFWMQWPQHAVADACHWPQYIAQRCVVSCFLRVIDTFMRRP